MYQPVEMELGSGTREGPDYLSARTSPPGSIRIQLLGDFRVRTGDLRIESRDWELRKAKNVVKLLALNERHRMHREEVMQVLWPSLPSESACNNLYKALHVARHTFEPNLLPRAQSAYVQMIGDFVHLSATGAVETDVKEFAVSARVALGSQDIEACRKALMLYAGDLLPEDRYEEWVISRREYLLALRFDVLMCLSRAQASSGDMDGSIGLAQQAIEADPLNEEAHTHLITLLARNGQRHLAVQQYRALCNTLREELNVEPDQRMRDLIKRIIEGGDPVPGMTRTAPPISLAGEVRSIDDLQVFGRDAEIARIEQLLDDFSEGDGGVIILRGESGIGKSSLAGAVARRAEQLGMPVGWLSGSHASNTLPMSERNTFPRIAALLIVDDPDDQERAVQVVRTIVTGRHGRPLIVLMTLHLETSESASVLEDLANELVVERPAGVMILRPLEDTTVELMARRFLVGRMSPGVLEWVRGVARGNPHYAQEAIQAILGRSAIQRVDGRWTLSETARSIRRDSLRRPQSRSAVALSRLEG